MTRKGPQPGDTSGPEGYVLRRELEAFVERLPEDQQLVVLTRSALQLRRLDASVEAIAHELKWPVSRVGAALREVRIKAIRQGFGRPT